MDIYKTALFLHVLGALGIFVALGLEWNALTGLRSAMTAEEAQRWLGGYGILRVLGPVSIGIVLVAGLYMTVASVGWLGWNTIGLGGMVVIFVLGAVSNGTRLPRIGRALAQRHGPLPQETEAQLREPLLWGSMLTRAAIAIGIVYLMTVRPDTLGSVIAIVLFGAAGVVVAVLTSRNAQNSIPGRVP